MVFGQRRTAAVDADSFEYLDRLGAGVFGSVYRVRHRGSGEICAMKILDRDKVESRGLQRYAMTERNVMATSHHPFVVPLRFAFQTPRCLVLVMRLCPGGNLHALLRREGPLSPSLARHYTAEVLLALQYLHDAKVLYRDLKPENVVLDEDRHAVLCDFGLSREQVQDTDVCGSFLGSTAYVAPEVLERTGHGRSLDVYGLGVLTYTLLNGQPPFYHQNREKMWHDIRAAPLSLPRRMPADAADFVEKTMKRDPAERLGSCCTADVQTHEYFSSIDFPAMLRREVPVPTFAKSPRLAPSGSGTQLCRCGHLLTTIIAEGEHVCDRCGANQPAGADLAACEPCRFYTCSECSRANHDAAARARWSQKQREALFGKRRTMGRAFRCFQREPEKHTPDWDFMGIRQKNHQASTVSATLASTVAPTESSRSQSLCLPLKADLYTFS